MLKIHGGYFNFWQLNNTFKVYGYEATIIYINCVFLTRLDNSLMAHNFQN